MDKLYELPFDVSMLDSRHVIIHCPNEDDAVKLSEILKSYGYISPDWDLSTEWSNYKGETCYVADGNVHLRYGRKSFIDSRKYFDNYIKCVFDLQIPEFDVPEDSDFLALVGIE